MPALSILLFNVWNLPSCCTDGNSRARAVRISPHLNNYDVVILNEAFVNKTELLAKTTHKYMKLLGRQWFTVFDSGVIILSKYPITAHAGEHYRTRRGVDFFAAKGVQFCQVNVDGQLVDIYGTHMQAGDKASHQMARKDQAHQLADFVNEHSNDASAVVVAGDLNMGPVYDPTFGTFSGHYTNEQDARDRSEAFGVLRDGAGLLDVYNVHEKEDICRFLVRNVKSAVITYNYDMDGATRELSDTIAVECLLVV